MVKELISEKDLLTESEADRVFIAGGFAHPDLTNQIVKSINAHEGDIKEKIHPNGEVYARYRENIRGKHVFVVQSHIRGSETTVNDAIMEQCLLIDAARSSSAGEITAVAPYLAYTRQDRKSKGREPIGARVILDQLAVAGADRIVTIDMHSAQSQGIFRGPFDHLTAQPTLRDAMGQEINGADMNDCLLVSPDSGASKMVEEHQKVMRLNMLTMNKNRNPVTNEVTYEETYPLAEDKVCLIFDDMIDTAGTLVKATECLVESGAAEIYVAATHAIFSDPAIKRLNAAPVSKIIVSDTYITDRAEAELGDKLKVISVAPIIGRAIVEIIRDGSISDLFDDQNNR